MRATTPYLAGYGLWSLGAGSLLSGALFALTRNYTLGIGGKAATCPTASPSPHCSARRFSPCFWPQSTIWSEKSERPVLSTLALRIGLLGAPLVAFGILLTALSQLSLINEGFQVLLGSLLLYPVYAWVLMRLAPIPEDMTPGLQRWASRLAWVWVAATFAIGALWIGGLAFEAPYVTGRGSWRLSGLIFLIYVVSMAVLYLAGVLTLRWRPLGVVFGWVIGAWLLALTPLVPVSTALIALNNFSYIE